MPTIRDLVTAIRKREGVEAAVVLGPDGVLIESQALTGMNTEDISAHLPTLIREARGFADAAARGELVTAVLEYTVGYTIVSVLSADALLMVLARPNADIGTLLYELRRNRENIAALV